MPPEEGAAYRCLSRDWPIPRRLEHNDELTCATIPISLLLPLTPIQDLSFPNGQFAERQVERYVIVRRILRLVSIRGRTRFEENVVVIESNPRSGNALYFR